MEYADDGTELLKLDEFIKFFWFPWLVDVFMFSLSFKFSLAIKEFSFNKSFEVKVQFLFLFLLSQLMP